MHGSLRMEALHIIFTSGEHKTNKDSNGRFSEYRPCEWVTANKVDKMSHFLYPQAMLSSYVALNDVLELSH